MRSASYTIELLPPGDLVSCRLAGFFTLADATAYMAEAERVIRACHARHGHYRMLLDVAGCAIQSQDVIAAFMAHVQAMPMASRSAVIVGSSIVRMQIRRVMTRPHVSVFGSRSEARRWVDEPALQQAS